VIPLNKEDNQAPHRSGRDTTIRGSNPASPSQQKWNLLFTSFKANHPIVLNSNQQQFFAFTNSSLPRPHERDLYIGVLERG
jgi:hypothetical protein